jgi:hypothetical protein
LVSVGQTLVVDTEKMKDRRVKVVDMDRIFDNIHAEIIGLPVSSPSLDPGPR